MKTLVVYASKYGCTADCASYLKTKISGDVTLVDINKAPKQIELHSFDTIVIGGSVYIGKISKKLRTFCENNLDVLTKKSIGIFLCAALSEQFNETLKTNFPALLLKSAKITALFGSEARLEKLTFLDKTIIKAVTKGDYSQFKIKKETMDTFANAI
ncbi:MAG: flavodoxin domain-containing protein [Defluviitaleaceae bacterium]|nr:flavodoxin domain-containing protein [Defluviitaleaceae bacterium]